MFKKTFAGAAAVVLALTMAMPAQAAVTVTTAPASLVTSPVLVKASSAPVGLFSFTLGTDATDTLTSIAVVVAQNGTTTVSSADLSGLTLYKDNGDGNFNSSTDSVVVTNSSVNVGSQTVLTAPTTTVASGKFFVSLSTGSSWSSVSPADSLVVTFPSTGISTSATTTPTTTPVTTASLTADTTGPVLSSALAQNTGGTGAKEAGDSVMLTFSEATNKPSITSGNIGSFFAVNNGHSFLDASSSLGSAVWNSEGTALTITLSGSASTSVPTVAVGDVVTVVPSSAFVDATGNQVTGTQAIIGSFGTPGGNAGHEGDDEDNDDHNGQVCPGGVVNGRLYKLANDSTVYLAAACRLKPFRGEAVFKARGKKFQDIQVLQSLPTSTPVSTDPVLPVAGTLVKGSDKTVWFVDSHGKRRGFVDGKHFLKLGFKFSNVLSISDSDLSLIPVGTPVQPTENHPDGSVIKCSNQPTVYQINGNSKKAFTSLAALQNKDIVTSQILIIDCQNFQYTDGGSIN